MTTTYEYSRLALEVYYDNPGHIDTAPAVGDEYKIRGTSTDGTLTFTPVTAGFFGAYYRDGAGNIIITYRGTDATDLSDWSSNIDWSTWSDSPPLELLDAYNFYLAVVAREGSSANISFTGHSLGGGLAGTTTPMAEPPRAN